MSGSSSNSCVIRAAKSATELTPARHIVERLAQDHLGCDDCLSSQTFSDRSSALIERIFGVP